MEIERLNDSAVAHPPPMQPTEENRIIIFYQKLMLTADEKSIKIDLCMRSPLKFPGFDLENLRDSLLGVTCQLTKIPHANHQASSNVIAEFVLSVAADSLSR